MATHIRLAQTRSRVSERAFAYLTNRRRRRGTVVERTRVGAMGVRGAQGGVPAGEGLSTIPRDITVSLITRDKNWSDQGHSFRRQEALDALVRRLRFVCSVEKKYSIKACRCGPHQRGNLGLIRRAQVRQRMGSVHSTRSGGSVGDFASARGASRIVRVPLTEREVAWLGRCHAC